MGNCFSQEHKDKYIPRRISIITPKYLNDVSLCTQEIHADNNRNAQFRMQTNTHNTHNTDNTSNTSNNCNNSNIVVLNEGYNPYDLGLGLANTNGFLTGILVGELLDDC